VIALLCPVPFFSLLPFTPLCVPAPHPQPPFLPSCIVLSFIHPSYPALTMVNYGEMAVGAMLFLLYNHSSAMSRRYSSTHRSYQHFDVKTNHPAAPPGSDLMDLTTSSSLCVLHVVGCALQFSLSCCPLFLSLLPVTALFVPVPSPTAPVPPPSLPSCIVLLYSPFRSRSLKSKAWWDIVLYHYCNVV
jgi:hypothetical protein